MPRPDAYLEGIENKRMMDNLRSLTDMHHKAWAEIDLVAVNKLHDQLGEDNLNHESEKKAVDRISKKVIEDLDLEYAEAFHKEMDKQIIDTLVGRMKKTSYELRQEWFNSLDEVTQKGIRDLMLVFGAPSIEEMFACWTPEKARQTVNRMFNLDLQKLWKEYDENA